MAKKPKQFLENDAWESFRKEYEAADDRSCAILCASYLDNCLEILIREALAHPEEAGKALLGEMMPLGTFSAKIRMAYCLNLFDDIMLKDLNSIRGIRNAFAHKLHGLSFGTDPIRSLVLGLAFPEDYAGGWDDDGDFLSMVGKLNPRERFIFTCAITTMLFEGHFLEKAKAVHQAICDAKVANKPLESPF